MRRQQWLSGMKRKARIQDAFTKRSGKPNTVASVTLQKGFLHDFPTIRPY